jgi:hypothetical protein
MKAEYEPVVLPVLATSACLFAIAGCFLTKWFEYDVVWDPPKKALAQSDHLPHYTQEQLPLFGVGPETFSQRLEGVDDTGCYVVGMCDPNEVPHRLYQADFTVEQKRWIYSLRVIGALGIAMSSVSLILTGLRYRTQLGSLFGTRPTRFVLGCVALLLAGGLVLLLFGLTHTMPLLSAAFGGNEYPIDCYTSLPPVVECSYYASLPPNAEIVEYELETGTSRWEFQRVLFPGPAWTALSFVMVVIVWLRGSLSRRQGLSNKQS